MYILRIPPSGKCFDQGDKLFDMMVIPGADHSIDSPYYFNLLRHYFAEHLLGGAIE